ncbi:Epl1p CYBJADRAFT_110969, partial [Cyberlindnera jadinii NRRL Y-1542]
ASNRFRQRKISTKAELQILKQSQISDIDNADLQQRELQEIETGVDKNEEGEEHLQKILKTTGLSNTANTYIPTPDASKLWPEAEKYYTGTFHHPESYIKSSCQVEDYSGCLYNMDESDEEFLVQLNKDRKKNPLTEDEFEILMYNFEKTITEKQPFLSTDPTQILSLEEITDSLLRIDKSSVENVTGMLAEELNIHPFITNFDAHLPQKPRELKYLVSQYGLVVYEHFKKRKIERNGQTITPILKFNGEDDNDAYICFRQRQFRQQRKTRRADVQSSEKLVKLYLELKATKELCFLVAEREKLRLEALEAEREIFELRCKVKNVKRELGITDSDEDLVAHKKKKPVPPPPQAEQPTDVKDEKKRVLSKTGNNANIDKSKVGSSSDGIDSQQQQLQQQQQQQQFQPYVKLPPSKIPDMELETVDRLLNNKKDSMAKFVEEKLKKRKLRDAGFINLTDDAYSPLLNLTLPHIKIEDASHLPYSSITSSFLDLENYGYVEGVEKFISKGVLPKAEDGLVFNTQTSKWQSKRILPEKYNPFHEKKSLVSGPQLTLRKRIGRLGQLYIDTRDTTRNDDIVFGEDEEEDTKERLLDQWKFDDDGYNQLDILSDDPARLNTISNDTQVIRFGGMLLSKAYDTLKDAMIQQRQQLYLQQLQKMQKAQQQR